MYKHDERIHNFNAANRVLPDIIKEYNIKSILDIGSGIGTWLKVAEENGVKDYIGIDGAWVDRKQLKIEEDHFFEYDLRIPLNLKRTFDLIICLEVAEHLPEESADTLIESIVSHGKMILFSSAVPEQGGQNHLNEQRHEYWSNKFNNYGFVYYDLIRPRIWNDNEIEWWYRQNIFLISKTPIKDAEKMINSNLYIHPELFYQVKESNIKLKKKMIKITQGSYSPFFYLSLMMKSILKRIKNG